MSDFYSDAEIPFDPARFYAPPKKSNVVMSNTYKPVVNNRPQYLIDRDREDEIASVKEDKELNKKIVNDAEKETEQEDYDRDPANYEANKLAGGLITNLGKLFHTKKKKKKKKKNIFCVGNSFEM